MSIAPSELSKLAYLRPDLIGDRTLNLAPLWDGTRWHLWTPMADGTLMALRPVECHEGSYFAREPARQDDLHLPFIELMWKRASWADVCHWVVAITDDLHNLATAVAKVDFFWAMRDDARDSVGRFVKNEIEYVLTVCRSILDELQEILRRVWDRVQLVDREAQKRKRPLPQSFADMIRRENRTMSAEEIAGHRHVPEVFADAYATTAPFVATLRGLRDAVIHGGHDAPLVFLTERGFAVRKDEPHVAALPVLKPEYEYNERLVSLRPVLAHLVMTTMYTLNTFGDLLLAHIELPPDIAPEHALFVRTVHGRALLRTQDVLRGTASPWWTDD